MVLVNHKACDATGREIGKEEMREIRRKNAKESQNAVTKTIGKVKFYDTNFPLKRGEHDMMPLTMQYFFKYNGNKMCLDGKDGNIKNNQYCLFRKGLRVNKNQSILEILAFVYKRIKNTENEETNVEPLDTTIEENNKYMTLEHLKKILVSHLNLDNFIRLNGGDLVNLFLDENFAEIDFTEEQRKLNANPDNYKEY